MRALAAGREVLDGFSYTGGFSIAALAGGAKHVTAIESSAPALEVAKENLAANPLDASKVEFVQADVFAQLARPCAIRTRTSTSSSSIRRSSRRPPRRSRKRRAPTRTSTSGRSSCSRPAACSRPSPAPARCPPELFQSIVAGAALDAGGDAKIIERFGAAADHPVALEFPEGEYLKGLLVLKG